MLRIGRDSGGAAFSQFTPRCAGTAVGLSVGRAFVCRGCEWDPLGAYANMRKRSDHPGEIPSGASRIEHSNLRV